MKRLSQRSRLRKMLIHFVSNPRNLKMKRVNCFNDDRNCLRDYSTAGDESFFYMMNDLHMQQFR